MVRKVLHTHNAIIGPPSYGGSYKTRLSLCLSILILVFFSEMAQQIFLIFGMIVDNWNI